jgi:hypothetical protein
MQTAESRTLPVGRAKQNAECRVVLAGVLAGRAFQQDLPFDRKCGVARTELKPRINTDTHG